MTLLFVFAKVIKGIENIFRKPLVRKKSLCIFALGFLRNLNEYYTRFLKIHHNE